MNILSFDIEEWYIEKMYHGNRSYRYQQFDRLLHEILDLLEKTRINATFFCLGELANEFPHVIRLIHEKGHEVACHSHRHYWLNKLSYQEVLEDTKNAVDALEQCIGEKVYSYRAPAFSIGESNKWAFEVLASCGIQNDASVFPAPRDFGGFSSFQEEVPTRVRYNSIEIKEFPIQTMHLLGKKVVYSGGGYFRLFPLSLILHQMKRSDYSMTYFHIGDLIQESKKIMSKAEYEEYFKECGSLKNRLIRYIKSNIGTGEAMNKLVELINRTNFVSLQEAGKGIDWDKTPLIQL